jgi:hypothetical protein
MTQQPPPGSPPPPTDPPPAPPPGSSSPLPAPPQHDDTMAAIAAVSVRLLAGAVRPRTLSALQRTVLSSPAEYPWQVVNQVVLAEPAEPGDLAQKALRAHRDWILRGGRETPGKPLSLRAKTLVAKVLAQLIFLAVYSLAVLVLLLLIKHKWPSADVYRLLAWLYEVFPGLAPK